MLLLRIAGVLAAIAIAALVGAWIFTGQKRYLGLAGKVGKAALAVALVFMVLLFAERLIAF